MNADQIISGLVYLSNRCAVLEQLIEEQGQQLRAAQQEIEKLKAPKSNQPPEI